VVFAPGAAVSPHVVDLHFRDADLLRFSLPRAFDRRSLEAWDVAWEPSHVQAGWCWMDLGSARFAAWWRESRDLKLLLFVDGDSEASYGDALRHVLPALQPLGGNLKVVFADPSTAGHAALLPHYGSSGAEARRLNRHGDAVVVAIRGGAALDGAKKWRSMSGHFTGPAVAAFAREFVAGAAADVAEAKRGGAVRAEL